jgi:phosphatidylglycerol---prolipoprotein diacylglyceryl transferase
MHPILFTINGVPIYAHGTFFVLGLLSGFVLLMFEAQRRHWSKEEVIPITLAAFVGGMVGARLSILFFNGVGTAPETLNFFSLFDPRVGPGSIIGAVLGAYAGGYVASRVMGKQDCTCDAFAPAMALATAVGRIGDYLAAEDGLGKRTDLPWGVTVPGTEYAVHPTPLYDVGFNLIWLVVLLLLRDHPKMQDGNLLKFGIAGYAVFRFLVEFVRNNPTLALGLTAQQFACLLMLAGLAIYYWRHVQRAGQAGAPA